MTSQRSVNPFTVRTPEALAAPDAAELFVNVFTDFHKIREPGHAMLNGPRGSGKSMMFRYLAADCLGLAEDRPLSDLDCFGVLVSIKNTELNLTELRTLSGKGTDAVLNEHFLTMFVASKVFSYLGDLEADKGNRYLDDVVAFVNDVVSDRLARCGLTKELLPTGNYKASSRAFLELGCLFDRLYNDVGQYVKRLFPGTPVPQFQGPLCGYLDFLYPVLCGMGHLPFMPNGPIYLLMDDADTLSNVQTRVLNSWVATRTSQAVSIKISTQMRYKTFSTVAGGFIETPHDYSEVNIADVYTTKRGRYRSRVKEIVAKRLRLADMHVGPEEFFPTYEPQEREIRRIEEEIRSGSHPMSGRGYRPSDDVVRYARPIYMRGLTGKRKASSKYSYAGFDQLVHISSGLIRHFLEPAALMYSEQVARTERRVERIDPGIQDQQITEMADLLMTEEFEKIAPDDVEPDAPDIGGTVRGFVERKRHLRNLIETLGGTFRRKLLSEDSERRVFSIAISDGPSEDVIEILELGVKHGYFQKSTIGNKDGTGRTPLYILTRRVAPYFRLDPSGFAGYLFVTNQRLREGMLDPQRVLRRIKKKGIAAAFGEEAQQGLFE